MGNNFWMHESAKDPEEFGGDTPEVALRQWLLYGAQTDEHDSENIGTLCVSDVVELGKHTIFKCEWVTVRDNAHLAELSECRDPLEDEWIDGLKVGDRFWRSVGHVDLGAQVFIKVT